jgi:hypothetical protein
MAETIAMYSNMILGFERWKSKKSDANPVMVI